MESAPYASAAATPSLRSRLPPGPERFNPFALATWIWRPLVLIDRLRRRYGDTFTMPDFSNRPPMLWTGDTDAIRDIFTGDPEALHAGEANVILEGILGSHSLLMLDGERHRRERKLMMPPFHGERMRAYGQVMRQITVDTVARWEVGSTFSLMPEMQAITLEIILRTVFGVEETSKLSALRDVLRELLVRATNPWVFGASIFFGATEVRDWIQARSAPVQLPGGAQLDLSSVVPGGRLYKLVMETDQLLRAEFAARRAAGDVAERTDILSMLLAARDESGAPMTDEQLRDEMVTLLIAGHETTATSLSWAFHHLMANPEVLARLQAELASPTGPTGTAGAPLTEEAIAGLEYLDAVVKETMRITPVVPLVARLTQREVKLGPFVVPAGVMVMPNVYIVHHRPDLYPEPERFRPERFLERKFGPHEYLPFGGGVRRCLGAAFATHEMKMVLAEVVPRVTLEPAGKPVKLERRGIIFSPSGGTRVKRVA